MVKLLQEIETAEYRLAVARRYHKRLQANLWLHRLRQLRLRQIKMEIRDEQRRAS